MARRMFTADDLAAGLPKSLRPYVLVDSAPLPHEVYTKVSKAFWTASKAIAPVVRVPSVANIIFATAPFRVSIANGELRYTPSESVVHACINNMIFIEVGLLMGYSFPT